VARFAPSAHNGAVSAPAPVPSPGLTVAAVARRLGVAPATLRTWDRRYGLGPSAHRTGAHRRYSASDIARLDHMRRLVMGGLPPADAAKAALSVDVAELATVTELETNSSESPAEGRAGGGRVVAIPGGTPAARGLARAAMALDGPACRDIIDETLDRRGVIWTWDHLLVPVLVGVGQRWQERGNAIDVEHVLSDSVVACLGARARAVRTGTNTAPVLLAAARDEMHSLPLWAVAAALAEHNISTRMLGDRVPPEVLAQSVSRIGPAVVLVWSSGRAKAAELTPMRSFRPAPVVLIGGPGWVDAPIEGIGQVTDLTSAVRRITQVVGG
jgi:transposase-like protein